jgi:heptosyltransferase-2
LAQNSKLLIVAPNWLGDAVMALPAIADVRRHATSTHIVVAARAPVADVFAMAPAVDETVTLQWNGRWKHREVLAGDVRAIEEAGVDVALLLPNSFAAAWMVSRARVAERWGYRTDWRGRLLSRAVGVPRRRVHQAAYYQHLTRELGFAAGPLEPELAVPDEAIATARQHLVDRGWDAVRPLMALAPGAAYGTAKRWIPQHVARLIANLVRQKGATCVLVGSRGDRPTTEQIQQALDPEARHHVIDMTGETTIVDLAAVFRVSAACVSNDSGAMHLAAAVGTPLVAIFGPTREHETAPLTRAGGRADVLTNPVWCRPCMLRECPIDHRCMKGIDPVRVLAAVSRLGSDPLHGPTQGVELPHHRGLTPESGRSGVRPH